MSFGVGKEDSRFRDVYPENPERVIAIVMSGFVEASIFFLPVTRVPMFSYSCVVGVAPYAAGYCVGKYKARELKKTLKNRRSKN